MLSNKNMALALEENARRRGGHPAIIEGERTITYRELDDHVRRIAGHLGDQGVGEGDIVGVCLRDCADHLMILYAVARLGAVILPLDWRWTEPEKLNVAQFFGVALVIAEPAASLAGVPSIEMDAAWQAAIAARRPDSPCAEGGARPVVLSLSSGTTGRPKGPALSHDQFIARFVMQWVTLGFNQHDRYLSATPLYFGGGRSFTMGSLFSGGTVIMFPPPYEPTELIEAARKFEATTLLLVPTLLRQLLALPGAGAPLLGGLSRLMSTGAILHPDERQAVMNRLNPNFINYYGSTEGGGTSVLLPGHTGEGAASVGEPIYQTEIQIVDSDGTELPAGEAGLIRYRGPAVADGFYNDPEASLEAFQGGWFYPGDIGRLGDDGLLYLVGRAKDVIIRSGVNIYPAEIEQILLAHPAVGDAVALPWPNLERGEDVAAFVVAREPVEEAVLLDHCRAALASYKVPRGIFFIDEMPKSALGKIIKADLAARLTSAG
ncbi:MAG: AMP-binding protein [Rhodospirillaceae bacterium]|nr:AMP-binding protein [Rhodospirillaceae bacterium]MBT4117934.1 AMP-binding protein [Rhodospirillaceae bacterium]MBT4671592.1 AMP-binding protein [Rhodospirillaceae bacterium]MBT4750940.1 AMP-binding protein [Rhodospirillaceae bacterium]MBT5180453.1 AMP-binding protein [Rhodospirillaceae bacterium]